MFRNKFSLSPPQRLLQWRNGEKMGKERENGEIEKSETRGERRIPLPIHDPAYRKDERDLCGEERERFVYAQTWLLEGTGYESRRTSKVITKLLQFMLEGPRPCTIFCFTFTLLVEYFNGNVSTGQLLQHFSKPIVACAGSRPKTITKTSNKENVSAS